MSGKREDAKTGRMVPVGDGKGKTAILLIRLIPFKGYTKEQR